MNITTNLIQAVKANKKGLVQALLAQGANPNKAEDKDNITPLHFAYLWKAQRVIPVLIEAGANPNAKNIDGLRPIDYT